MNDLIDQANYVNERLDLYVDWCGHMPLNLEHYISVLLMFRPLLVSTKYV